MPTPGESTLGRISEGNYRLRPTWWGGVVLEELIRESDGTKRWRKARNAVALHFHL